MSGTTNVFMPGKWTNANDANVCETGITFVFEFKRLTGKLFGAKENIMYFCKAN